MQRMALALVVVAAFTGFAAADDEPGSYLIQPYVAEGGKVSIRSFPYEPNPGDMVFFNDHSKKWGLLYKLVGSDAPYHAGLVFRKPDGQCAFLESGPDDTQWCRIMEIKPRLENFKGTVHIRRVKTPLTKEQEAVHTDWCMQQEGKRYAFWRLLLQATPFRSRSPLRREYFGKTYENRDRWLCAELVIAGNAHVGLFDRDKHRANSMYPRDIFYDDVYDLSAHFHPAEMWSPLPISDKLLAR
jgi:hypothetical protein